MSDSEWLARLNARHAVVRLGGRALVVTEDFDPVLERIVYDFGSFHDFRNLYSNRLIYEDAHGTRRQAARLGQAWLDHPKRRQYERIIYSPGKDIEGCFNLWRGFAVDPAPGDWSLFQNHLFDNICSGNPDWYQYLLHWMAFAVQWPGEPAEVAVVLQGSRGSGKGVFGRIFGSLFGQHYIHVSSARHLTGNFNVHLRDASFVFADEVVWTGDKEAEGVLKMLITEEILPIEPKGRDVQFAKNVIHLLIASNEEWVIPAGLDERRFFALMVAAERAQDRAYFGALAAQMQNGGRAAMLHDLLQIDLSGFDITQVPATAALEEQKLRTMASHQRWWFEKLKDGQLLPMQGWPTTVKRDNLREDYAKNAGAGNRSAHGVATELGIVLKRLLPPGYPRTVQRKVPHSDGSMAIMRFWEFPPLDACRAHFETTTRSKYTWDEPSTNSSQPGSSPAARMWPPAPDE